MRATGLVLLALFLLDRALMRMSYREREKNYRRTGRREWPWWNPSSV